MRSLVRRLGGNQAAFRAHAMEFKTRVSRLEEVVALTRRLLAGELVTHDGRYYQLRDARCEPKPVQRPHPPILIGGSGPKRTLRAAARWAQHWNHAGALSRTKAGRHGSLQKTPRRRW